MVIPLTFDHAFAEVTSRVHAAGWRPKILEVDEMVPHIADILYAVKDASDPDHERIER